MFITSLLSIKEVSIILMSVPLILVQAPGSGFRERIRACRAGESIPFWEMRIFS